MRNARIIAPAHHEKAYYHCVSRIVNREFVLHEEEKEKFVELMRTYEKLYGLRVLTYCVMTNHFHILVEVPQRPEKDLSDEELVKLVGECLGEKEGRQLKWRIDHYIKQNNQKALQELRELLHGRMWNISQFMKVLKGRFSQWFNKKHSRTGTLWEGRFNSTLVQGEGRALKTMAGYIDLNPVRAKMHDDPKDYRWCGYAEAVAGQTKAREALHYLTTISHAGGLKPEEYRPTNQRESLEMWRRYLYGVPENPRMVKEYRELQAKAEARYKGSASEGKIDVLSSSRQRLPREKALEVLAKEGKLNGYEILSCRVRYFTDGAAIGAKSFVEEVFQANREKFGKRRKEGAQRVNEIAQGMKEGFHTLRTLKEQAFT